MTEIVTEGEYTRGFILSLISLYTSLLFGLLAGISGMVIKPPELGLIVLALSALFVVYFMSISRAMRNRGVCHWVWSLVVDIPWTLDDIDPDEFVDGPVEVNDE